VVRRTSIEPSRDPADYRFVHRLRTRFAETDAMGIIHHAAYLPYLEEARVAYLRSIGHPYDEVRRVGAGGDGVEGEVGDVGGGDVGGGDAGDGEARDEGRDFPVLEASVHYRKPLHFDDEVDVSLRIGAVTGTTFQIAYLLTVDGGVRATAVTVHGCVDGRGRPCRLPDWVRGKS
jgi:acyl-CoA thioester hydrolase